jgi:hypothetical protein
VQAPDITKYRWKTDESSARRMAETFALHQLALAKDELLLKKAWVAIRLTDGGSDNTVYETRADAVRSTMNAPTRHLYFPVPLERMNAQTCDVLLWYVRKCYDAGSREDPRTALMLPTRIEDMMRNRVPR